MINQMKYLISILFCLQLVTNPKTIDDLEINWNAMPSQINHDKSIIVDNTGVIHFYVGGIDESVLFHFCTIHNLYEEVTIHE